MKRKQRCTMCGKKFKIHDQHANLHFKKQIGYGSIHDGDIFELNLCCGCFDTIANLLQKVCKKELCKKEPVYREMRTF